MSMSGKAWYKGLVMSAFVCLAATPAAARLVSLDVVSVEPAFAGRSFGEVGTYERVVAKARYAVSPAEPGNAGIVDLALAPRNAAGEVEFGADVEILRPAHVGKGNARILYDVPNRGGKLGLALLNDTPYGNSVSTKEAAGNGHVFELGYTVVWSAWQPDVAPVGGRQELRVPVVPGVTGTSREEAVFDNTTNPVVLDLTYPASTQDPAQARLSVRNNESDARATPEGLSFRYLSPTRIEITRPQTAHLGAIYEFIYPATGSTVAGLGFAAVRDLLSHLRYDAPAALVGGKPVETVLGFGFSQSGRYLRGFVQDGFNSDEKGRIVFDGILPHAAGSRGVFLNARFAQPGRYSREHEDHVYPGDQFPFAWGVSTDPVSGRTGGLLASARNQPKVIQTDTALEVWQGRSSLLNTDGKGRALAEPDNVRLFLLAGLPHFPVVGQKSAASPICKYPTNTLFPGAPLRALLQDLDDWASQGKTPPASRFPKADAGQWLAPDVVPPALAKVPGFAWSGVINAIGVVDHAQIPPKVSGSYFVGVPRTDNAGHEQDALRLPVIDVPRATYLGWNERRYGYGERHLCGLAGSRLPLAATKAEREKSGDPRPSLEERYPAAGDYLAQVKASAARLVAERLLLPADAERIVRQAAADGALD